MSNPSDTPRILKSGIVLMDATSGRVKNIIVMQFNPETLTRTLQPQGMGDSADRSEVLRLKGPPVETLKLDAEIDATDQIDGEAVDSTTSQYGIFPQLSLLETMVYPTSASLQSNNTMAGQGKLEIIPVEMPLMLFVWSKHRVVPVRLTEFSITEEMFDANLNPIRAKVGLGMRVLNVNDLGFQHRGGSIYMRYQQQKEQMATLKAGGAFSDLGIRGVN